MEIVTLSFVYIAWFECTNGAVFHTQQHGVNHELTCLHPFHIPPGSQIVIQKMQNDAFVPGTVVQGTLHRVPANFIPHDGNQPYGNAFVVVDEGNCYNARLRPSRQYNHIGYDDANHNVNDNHHENVTYTCWIRRPPLRGMHATLIPFNEEGHNHEVPHIHYTITEDVHFEGGLEHFSFDDLV